MLLKSGKTVCVIVRNNVDSLEDGIGCSCIYFRASTVHKLRGDENAESWVTLRKGTTKPVTDHEISAASPFWAWLYFYPLHNSSTTLHVILDFRLSVPHLTLVQCPSPTQLKLVQLSVGFSRHCHLFWCSRFSCIHCLCSNMAFAIRICILIASTARNFISACICERSPEIIYSRSIWFSKLCQPAEYGWGDVTIWNSVVLNLFPKLCSTMHYTWHSCEFYSQHESVPRARCLLYRFDIESSMIYAEIWTLTYCRKNSWIKKINDSFIGLIKLTIIWGEMFRTKMRCAVHRYSLHQIMEGTRECIYFYRRHLRSRTMSVRSSFLRLKTACEAESIQKQRVEGFGYFSLYRPKSFSVLLDVWSDGKSP